MESRNNPYFLHLDIFVAATVTFNFSYCKSSMSAMKVKLDEQDGSA